MTAHVLILLLLVIVGLAAASFAFGTYAPIVIAGVLLVYEIVTDGFGFDAASVATLAAPGPRQGSAESSTRPAAVAGRLADNRGMRRHAGLVLFLCVALVGCTFGPSAAPEPTQTYINVAEVAQSQEMTLEVGDTAWSFTADSGGGVATPELSETETARIVAVDDCQEYAEFDAVPGRAYLIRVEFIGTVTVEDITNTGMGRPMGPGLVERHDGPTDCGPESR